MAPLTRNSIAKSVLPQPGPPAINVGRPLGRPPPVISSMPGIPVGDFGRSFICFFCFSGVTKVSPLERIKSQVAVKFKLDAATNKQAMMIFYNI
jgi:hypothetical protein